MTPNAMRLAPVVNTELAIASDGPAVMVLASCSSDLPPGDGKSVFAGPEALCTLARMPFSLGTLPTGSPELPFDPPHPARIAASRTRLVASVRAVMMRGLG